MLTIQRVFFLLFLVYATFFSYMAFLRWPKSNPEASKEFLYSKPESLNDTLNEFLPDKSEEAQMSPQQKLQDKIAKLESLWTEEKAELPVVAQSLSPMTQEPKNLTLADILVLLGAYPEIGLPYVEPTYDQTRFELNHDDDYCLRADDYNLKNPNNMFKNKIYYTNYANIGFATQNLKKKFKVVHNQIGKNTYLNIKYQPASFNVNVTRYYINLDTFANYYKVGHQFLCVTQMFNNIPGHNNLAIKELVIDQANLYMEKYRDKPQCFNKTSLFPLTYRLYNQTECKEFFTIINSDQYKESLKDEPIQYLTKVGRDSHQGKGVIILDQTETDALNTNYEYGLKCGENNQSLLAQAYLTNPLLVNKVNKFDFRVYMLIASTNPLIVFYHDGFLRISLSTFNKTSSDKSVHLTNTHISAEVKKNSTDVTGDNWMSFQNFQKYLLEEGIISDPNWLDNYLRPAFKRALIHLVRMTKDDFWKQSNVYGLHGVDFMLDDQLNLWFIESNPSPQMGQGSKLKNKIYESVFHDHLDITNAYYMSRMKRLTNFMKTITKEDTNSITSNIEKWREEYQKLMRNKIEPEYKISKTNSYKMIMNENFSGKQVYFGHIPSECI